MSSEYLIVSQKILPAFYDKVVQARTLLETKKCRSVQDAVKQVGISRSTYYKYKDFIFRPSEEFGRRFTFSMMLEDNPGILSKILRLVSEIGASIVTIHQDIPINHSAVVVMTLDGSHMNGTIDELTKSLSDIEGVNSVELMAME
jgi:chorismate mutase